MDDLVTFLRARLNEEAAGAQAAADSTSPSWRVDDDGETLLLWDPMPDTWGMGHTISEAVTAHIVRHDPARVLAEVKAKRKIVDEYKGSAASLDAIAHPDMYDVGRVQGLEAALQMLALPYADHPDYQDAWRP